MKKFLLIVLALISISGIIFSGCAKPAPAPAPAPTPAPAPAPAPTPAPAPAKTLKIGALLSVSGWYSNTDAEEEVDLKIVAQMINDKGGLTIQGQKYNIELVIEDGKSSLDGVTAAANKLVLDDKVKFVVGPGAFFSSGSTAIFEAAKVLHVSAFNTLAPGEMSADSPYGFVGFDNPIVMVIVGFKAIQQEFPNVKNVALVSADDGTLPYTVPIVQKALSDIGFTVVGDVVKFPNETEDFSPIAAKVNAITQADAYSIVAASPPGSCQILKGLRALGNQKPFTFNADATEALNLAGKDASTNAVCRGTFTPGQPDNPPLLEEALNKGKLPRNWFGMAPNALWVLAQVIQAADSLDPDVVKAKWESMDTVSTLYGEGILGGDVTYGLHHHAVIHSLPWAKLDNGQALPGGWVEPGAGACP